MQKGLQYTHRSSDSQREGVASIDWPRATQPTGVEVVRRTAQDCRNWGGKSIQVMPTRHEPATCRAAQQEPFARVAIPEHRGPVLRHSRSKDMNQAQSVCKRHYTPPPQRSTCSKCPIQSACHSGTGPRLTAESIGAWQERMESAAVEWLRKH